MICPLFKSLMTFLPRILPRPRRRPAVLTLETPFQIAAAVSVKEHQELLFGISRVESNFSLFG